MFMYVLIRKSVKAIKALHFVQSHFYITLNIEQFELKNEP